MRCGARRSHWETRPHPNVAGARQSHCEKRPDPNVAGPQWLQSNRALCPNAVRAPSNPSAKEALTLMPRVARQSHKTTQKEVHDVMWQGAQCLQIDRGLCRDTVSSKWLQSDGGPSVDAERASAIPLRRGPPRWR